MTVNWRSNIEIVDRQLHSLSSTSTVLNQLRTTTRKLPLVQNRCDNTKPGFLLDHRGPRVEAWWPQLKGPQINGLTADKRAAVQTTCVTRDHRTLDIGDSGPSREHRDTSPSLFSLHVSLPVSHPPQDPCPMSKLLPFPCRALTLLDAGPHRSCQGLVACQERCDSECARATRQETRRPPSLPPTTTSLEVGVHTPSPLQSERSRHSSRCRVAASNLTPGPGTFCSHVFTKSH